MWEVSWRRRETATYWPQVPLTLVALLTHSAGLLNWGPEGPSPLSGAGSHCLKLQLELQLQLTVAPGYIIVWCLLAASGHRICTEFNPFTGQGDIFDPMHLFLPLIYAGASLNWRLSQGSICYINISISFPISALVISYSVAFFQVATVT